LNKVADKIEALIKLAKLIIKSDSDYSLLLVDYLAGLDQIDSLKPEISINKLLKPSIQELFDLHQAVIDKVEEEKSDIKSRIGSLRTKGKAVLKYTDQMPKSISIKTRKRA
jgi:hypothetical protein